MKNLVASLFIVLAAVFSGPLRAQEHGQVVEEIVARVNNRIITVGDLRKAQADMRDSIKQGCSGCTEAQLEAQYADQSKDLLRDLIDQALLVDRAKDLDIKVDTELVKRLDEVRIQNNLPSMEALQKAVESQGMDWEDYKSDLQDRLYTQDVIRQEVGSRIIVDHAEVQKYYDEHKAEFNRPEQVVLEEIFFSTEGKTPDQLVAIRKKADDVLKRVQEGADFNEMAKRYSDGTTAKDGGDLGTFERGQLSKQIDDLVFKMTRGQLTDIIQTDKGLEIIRVDQHFDAGLQPLTKVEPEITNKLYSEQMVPTLRQYLAELREESYLVVKPGYVDTAAVAANTESIEEVSPTPDSPDKKKSKKHKKDQG
jgi:peptidyl-prolyl cis-trans isomerase SurA